MLLYSRGECHLARSTHRTARHFSLRQPLLVSFWTAAAAGMAASRLAVAVRLRAVLAQRQTLALHLRPSSSLAPPRAGALASSQGVLLLLVAVLTGALAACLSPNDL